MLKTVSSITNAIGALNYKGTWNATTNTPALASGVGTKGDYYVVSVAGTTSLDGISTWYVGDWAAFNGTVWQRLEGGVDDPAPSLKSNSTTGLMQITGPATGQTRVVTIPDADATMARTDAAQTFSGQQTFTTTVDADGLRSHAGLGGAFNSNSFNLQWTGSAILWVDTVSLGAIQTISDYRVKKNIRTQTARAIDRVMRLRPIIYEMADYGDLFKADGVEREGFAAHEVQEIIPSGAEGRKDEKGRIQNLRIDAILSVVVKAMQEQQQQIESLKAEVAALKGL